MGAEAGAEGDRPYEAFVRDHLEVAAGIRELLTLRRTQHGTKDPTRSKIDLAFGRRPRRRREPLLHVLRHRPRLPDTLRGDVDHALDHEIELRIHGNNVRSGHLTSPF